MRISRDARKIGMILGILGLSLLFYSALAAAERPTVIAWRAEEPLVIDGDLGEWNTSSPIVLKDEEQLIRHGHVWMGPDDLSAEVYVMWDEENLYIGANIVEDTPFGAIAMLPIDGNDNIALYFSTNPQADPDRIEYETTDWRVIMVLDNYYWDTGIDRSMVKDKQLFWSRGMDGGESVLAGYEAAAIETAVGYTFEAKIPWQNFTNSSIPLYTPREGDRISFNVVITDIDYPCPGTEYVPQIAWTGDYTLNQNPSVWGILVFK